MTTHEHPTIFRALPMLSILQSPAHSPSFLLLSTLIKGIWCSEHRAATSFLYIGSSQFSASTQSSACRLSRALAASCKPRITPLWIRAVFRTSWSAWFTSRAPPDTAGAEGASSLQVSKNCVRTYGKQGENMRCLDAVWGYTYTSTSDILRTFLKQKNFG